MLEAEIGIVDLIPRAVFSMSVDEFAQLHNFNFESGEDDLDRYRVLYLRLDEITNAALIHHQHEPANELTLYLDRSLGQQYVGTTICDLIDCCGGWARLQPSWLNLSHSRG